MFACPKLASSDASKNPSLYQAHHVFIPYCSQDLWSGRGSSDHGLHFSGHAILEAVLAELKSAPDGIASADTVVLAGGSAGGVGVWLNVDWVQAKLPGARVLGAPIGGFYGDPLLYRGVDQAFSKLARAHGPAWPDHVGRWGSFLPEGCVEALGEESASCILAAHSGPFVKAPMFVTQAQTDSIQIEEYEWQAGFAQEYLTEASHPELSPLELDAFDDDVAAYLEEWKANQAAQLEHALKAVDGLFSPACFCHTGFTNIKPLVHEKPPAPGTVRGCSLHGADLRRVLTRCVCGSGDLVHQASGRWQ